MSIRLTLGADDAGRRVDRLLRKSLGDLPLSAIHRLLRTGKVRLDGRKAAASDRPPEGAVLEIPELEGLRDPPVPPPSEPPEGSGGNLEILWRGSGLLIVSKPSGLLVHGDRSLEDRVRAYLSGSLAPSLSFRPGPLHRLDRGTSGIVAFSTSLEGARTFSAALRNRLVRKRYLAILDGEMGSEETWEDELSRDTRIRKTDVVLPGGARKRDGETGIEGKRALSRAIPLAAAGGRTLAIIEIGTGRTHQIRAQAASRGHPLAGDRKYGGSAAANGFFLHAYEIAASPEAGIPLPPVIVARPPDAFRSAAKDAFGDRVAGFLAAALPTDLLLDAII